MIFGLFVASLVLLEFILRYDESVAEKKTGKRVPPRLADLDRPPQVVRTAPAVSPLVAPASIPSAPIAPANMMSLAQALQAEGRGTAPSLAPAPISLESDAAAKLVK